MAFSKEVNQKEEPLKEPNLIHWVDNGSGCQKIKRNSFGKVLFTSSSSRNEKPDYEQIMSFYGDNDQIFGSRKRCRGFAIPSYGFKQIINWDRNEYESKSMNVRSMRFYSVADPWKMIGQEQGHVTYYGCRQSQADLHLRNGVGLEEENNLERLSRKYGCSKAEAKRMLAMEKRGLNSKASEPRSSLMLRRQARPQSNEVNEFSNLFEGMSLSDSDENEDVINKSVNENDADFSAQPLGYNNIKRKFSFDGDENASKRHRN